jgi:membrane-bound lytic murein transglycosylase MltF
MTALQNVLVNGLKLDVGMEFSLVAYHIGYKKLQVVRHIVKEPTNARG